MKVPFYRHSIGEEEIRAVVEVLRSPFLTTAEKNEEFETLLADYLGVRYALTTSSCTSALHLALLALGIGEGDEVVVPALTFMATANVVIHAGATPIFVDVEGETGLMDLNQLEDIVRKRRPRAVIPVHIYGQMVDMEGLMELSEKYGFHIIEDAAHSLESTRKGIRPGQLSRFACFSFYATKNITSGEGGAIAFNDPAYYERLKRLRLHGMSLSAKERHGRFVKYDMPEPGWKYNMTNFQAAMLIPQLKRIEEMRDRRAAIVRRYRRAFGSISFPRIIDEEGTRSAHHLTGILVEDRERIALEITRRGVGISAHYPTPVPLLSWYRKTFGFQRGMFPRAEHIADRIITLPLYPSLTDGEQDYVIETVKEVLGMM